MKNYVRTIATSAVVLFGLSVAASAHQGAAMQTTDTAAKTKRHRKAKDTSATGSAMATATTATSATKSAATTATSAVAAAPAAATSATTKAATKAKSSVMPTATASASDIAAAKTSGMVWVNTGSATKAYHKSSSKYFGATKAGKFMSEADAQKAGYHLAKD